MKDPLKYFLQEGFGNIYAFPIEDGKTDISVRWVKRFKDFTPKFTISNGNYVFILKGVTYVVNQDFINKYAVFVENEHEALRLIAEKNAEWETIAKEHANISI